MAVADNGELQGGTDFAGPGVSGGAVTTGTSTGPDQGGGADGEDNEDTGAGPIALGGAVGSIDDG